jgi:hypothetical protein
MESSERHHLRVESDVGAAARHVGGDRDPVPFPGPGNHARLLRVLEGVQELEPEPSLLEAAGQLLAGGHAAGSHQDRPSGRMDGSDLLQHGPPAVLGRGQDPVTIESTL